MSIVKNRWEFKVAAVVISNNEKITELDAAMEMWRMEQLYNKYGKLRIHVNVNSIKFKNPLKEERIKDE